jgi:hypothetical protein
MSLLDLALSVQESQIVSYYKFLSQSVNDIGRDIPVYDTPIDLDGSFQPISQDVYQQNGFDLNKKYFVFYTSNDLNVIDRNTSGDKLIYASNEYQVLDKNDWFSYDGFEGVTCVRQ